VLTDPDSDAITIAADRYYAERSPDSASGRVRHTLRLLTGLKNSANGGISVRLSSHPLTTAIIAIDTKTTTPASTLFAECYSCQARGDGPKFVLQPADGHWFTHFTAEAERLWENGQPHSLQVWNRQRTDKDLADPGDVSLGQPPPRLSAGWRPRSRCGQCPRRRWQHG